MRNSCADCHFFYYDKAPFGETYTGCDKQHWTTPSYETDFRYALRKALKCIDFKHVTFQDLEPGLTASSPSRVETIPVSFVDRQMAKAFETNLSLKRRPKHGSKK